VRPGLKLKADSKSHLSEHKNVEEWWGMVNISLPSWLAKGYVDISFRFIGWWKKGSPHCDMSTLTHCWPSCRSGDWNLILTVLFSSAFSQIIHETELNKWTVPWNPLSFNEFQSCEKTSFTKSEASVGRQGIFTTVFGTVWCVQYAGIRICITTYCYPWSTRRLGPRFRFTPARIKRGHIGWVESLASLSRHTISWSRSNVQSQTWETEIFSFYGFHSFQVFAKDIQTQWVNRWCHHLRSACTACTAVGSAAGGSVVAKRCSRSSCEKQNRASNPRNGPWRSPGVFGGIFKGQSQIGWTHYL
jgi:hypothetical protein